MRISATQKLKIKQFDITQTHDYNGDTWLDKALQYLCENDVYWLGICEIYIVFDFLL